MAVYLLYSPGEGHNNSSGRNAVIVTGTSEAAARAAAQAASPDGETKVPQGWSALRLALGEDDELAARGVIWLGRGGVEPSPPVGA